MVEHLLSLADIGASGVNEVLEDAAAMKRRRGKPGNPRPLADRSVAMIFSKSSTRTRVSFEVGIAELGGHSMYFDAASLQLGRGETMGDTAKVLSRYLHAAVIRCHAHEDIEEFAAAATIPVVNALTDRFHPCQLLADMLTIREQLGRVEGVRVAFLGDGACNMANSWALAARLCGMHLVIGAPEPYQLDPALLDSYAGPGTVEVIADPEAAVHGADIVYTDVWVSMGFEEEQAERRRLLEPYQVTPRLMHLAAPHARFMHCLPAHRGEEVAAAVIDGPASVVWDEAENRLHAQKAVLARLMG